MLQQDTFNFQKFYHYTDVHQSLINTDEFENIVIEFVDIFEESGCLYESKEDDYEIFSYSEVEEFPVKIRNSYYLEKIIYDNKENIYFYKLKENDCRRMYVVKNGKIISFFTYVNTAREKIRPFVFNKKLSEDDWIIMRL